MKSLPNIPITLASLLLVVLAVGDSVAQPSPSALEGRWVSRSCEILSPTGELPNYITRDFTFTETEWELELMVYLDRECSAAGMRVRIGGAYELGDQAAEPTYTDVREGNFFYDHRTNEPLDPFFVNLLNTDLAFCFPDDLTWELNTPVDTITFDCDALGMHSQQSCSDGEYDLVAIYEDGALHLGDRFQTASMCQLPRPTLLEPKGLVRFEERSPNALGLARSARLSQNTRVQEALALLSEENMRTVISEISANLHNRYYSTDEAVEAALYFERAYGGIAAERGRVQAELFENTAVEPLFRQPSVIGRIRGRGASERYRVMVGAHIDSCAFIDPDTGVNDFTLTGENPAWATRRAPGADDDLSGSAVLLEVFRVLVQSGFEPDRTLEFVGFAGEEKGIVDGEVHGKAGSELLARHYRQQGVDVVGLLNLDSIGADMPASIADDVAQCNPLGSAPNRLPIFGYGDVGFNIDPSLRDLLFSCVEIYCQSPYSPLEAPNGQSDHLSFIGNLYPAGGAVESNIYANGLADTCPGHQVRHHSERDTVDGIDFVYLMQYARAVLGFVVEAGMRPESTEPRFGSALSDTIVIPSPKAYFDGLVPPLDGASSLLAQSVLWLALLCVVVFVPALI